ncbi:uncharacterized protein ACLA_090450 [Aspergillus clavatus NRRL 1]|uniref:AT hook motif protein n=1 Tax=Aspergillus clavatus (strain ATCC 1007 / CBS 513.65 / DSM 816 / NCTC 3887 / NRRL 1 / QM 1276 / 107) TaxID=344612 RepID=A1CEQ3_ASPCL|nr:AT hook motif protein [Aspergillus clavatus NRRL 1]EAW11352.1 AT hook motif protein [Aspergillus clavatus NRRL 1]
MNNSTISRSIPQGNQANEMTTDREERLQMRQRGAATRKPKEIDFGFSFGLASAAEEPTSQTTSQPAETGIVTELAAPPAPTPVPEVTGPPNVSPVRAPSVLHGLESSQRTPRSARNGLPERPSMFDIPSDENVELERSNKRRKIGSPSKFAAVTTSTGLDLTVPDNSDSQPLPNESASNAPIPAPNEPDSLPSVITVQAPQNVLESDAAAASSGPVGGEMQKANGNAGANHAGGAVTIISDELQAQIVSAPPPADNDRNIPDSESHNRAPPQDYVAPDQLVMTQSPAEPDRTEPTPPKQVPPAQVSLKQRSPKSRSPAQRSSKQVTPEQGLPEQTIPEQTASNEAISEQLITEEIALQEVITRQATPQQDLPEQVVPESGVPEQADESAQQATQSSQGGDTQQVSIVDAGESQPQRQRRPRGRPPAASRAGSSANASTQKAKAGSIEVSPPPVNGNQRLRSRGTRTGQSTSRVAAENGALNGAPAPEQEETQPEAKSDNITNKEQEAETTVPQHLVRKKKGRAGRPAKVRPAEIEQDKPQPSDQNAEQETQKDPEKEQEPESQLEVEKEAQIPPASADESQLHRQPESALRPKKRRGRPSLASKRNEGNAGGAEERQERQETQPETGEEAPQPVKKRTRQPRGETVPVTVHRLVNVASLAELSRPDSPAEEEDSADELAARRKTKLPKRGGVNPADVLSQICRETLEKTLTTLKNGIANETNPARRAEWTRKKKAVEAFETELEGRLFELSEMLDSNFVLSVQLRKAKREMMDLRGRLYQVRKEREGVALRVDAVRRKHAEEEEARMARMSISNSLHSLELAVERGQNRASTAADEEDPTDASPTSGLEFLLRSVAENVSSAAPGAQGGLLDQMKSLNAQLEATARRLES